MSKVYLVDQKPFLALLTFSNNAQKLTCGTSRIWNWLGPHREGVLQSNELSAGYRIHNHGSIHALNNATSWRFVSPVISVHTLWHNSRKQLVFLRFWWLSNAQLCDFDHSTAGIPASTLYDTLESPAPLPVWELAAIARARFDAKACVGWDIYSTNLAWPGWTTSMENYLQVTNLDHIILPCHGMPWGDLVPAPPCTTTVRSIPSAELKIPFVPATRIRQTLVGSVRTNASHGDKQLWKQGYLKCSMFGYPSYSFWLSIEVLWESIKSNITA